MVIGSACAALFVGCRSLTAAPDAVHNAGTPARSEPKAVFVRTRQESGVTHFYVQNQELCEVTMTFEMGLSNLTSNIPFPATLTFPPKQETEAFSLSPENTAARWEYSYTNYYKLGSNCAKHDDNYIYDLPYAPGSAFKVTQGYNGTFSHKGSNKYAIDWKMPEGTPVYAARGGMVIKVKDDSNTGGGSLKYDPYNNYVLIRHPDGTLGHYCHLQKHGVRVVPGQMVQAGDLIAHSGNTGFSSGPHLHFCVFKTRNGRERESIPVRFKTAEATAITLESGRNYKASRLAGVVATSGLAEHQGGVAP